MNQARRVNKINEPTLEELMNVFAEDIPAQDI